MTIQARVAAALDGLLDPCSRFNGSMLSLRELGMLRDVDITPDRIVVELFLDDPTCVFAGQITAEARAALEPVAEGREIGFSMVVDEYWGPERITAAARRRLDAVLERRRALLPLSVRGSRPLVATSSAVPR